MWWIVAAGIVAVVVALIWYGDKLQKEQTQVFTPQPIDYDLITRIVKDRLQEEITEEVIESLYLRVKQELEQFYSAPIENVSPPPIQIDEDRVAEILDVPTDRLFRQSVQALPQELQDMGVWEGAEFAISEHVRMDVAKVPHWLIAGATGQGKSSMLNTILLQAIQRDPSELKLVLLDPKRVEFAAYENVPHLWKPVATELGDMIDVLEYLVKEMESRYMSMKAAGKRSIDGMGVPRIMCVIDELGDLMLQQGKIVEPLLIRLTQLGRAAGIHVIAATQRPSVDVITGVLKANLPGRIALRTASAVDSRVIIDKSGAETLRKPGEFILVSGVEEERGRGVFVDEDAIARAA